MELRKVLHLSERVGFYLPISNRLLASQLNHLFNLYCKLTRSDHKFRNFLEAETTKGKEELKVEQETFFIHVDTAAPEATSAA